ncbi:uncharacterized protein LOC110245522 [Exaiptasia diaphana]|uniref:Uncharacterized protein n=1 Tax=Exaiptasia diaphana TaxID=2652724 RepID=A0A913YQK2_EXADI|nr:uncharacterized protein LOC110245522 [Exaiptasia diaphana]
MYATSSSDHLHVWNHAGVNSILLFLFRCTVDLVIYLGCSFRTQQDMKFLLNLPSVVCTILLLMSYAIFLYQQIQSTYRGNNAHPTCREIFLANGEKDEAVAEDIDWDHVSLLLANKAHRRRSPSTTRTLVCHCETKTLRNSFR